MKKVVLFRSVCEDYQNAFNAKEYEPLFIQPLQFTYVNLDELSNKLQRNDYDGLILSSPRAIEALSNCWDPGKYLIWKTKKIYTVGEPSSNKIRQLLGLEAQGVISGNAENLAKIVINENTQTSRFLFPCGNLRSETIPEMLQSKGITVDSITVYESRESESLRSELIDLSESEDTPCCMVFFSPSGCEYIHRQLQTFRNNLVNLPHFAIGNSTAHKIENFGFDIAGVASKPKAESIVDTVEKYFMHNTS